MEHECTYRVPYADTDQMGVVYYANYLEYFERSRTEMFRAAGLPYSALEERGLILPVVEANLRYRAPARYDWLLTFRSHVAEIGRARVTIATQVLHEGKLLVEGSVTLGSVNQEMRPCRLPEEVVSLCRTLMPDDAK